jgi:hypothetical protein
MKNRVIIISKIILSVTINIRLNEINVPNLTKSKATTATTTLYNLIWLENLFHIRLLLCYSLVGER